MKLPYYSPLGSFAWGGDYNLNFDKTKPPKPNCVRMMERFFSEFDIVDAGSDKKETTWRRPHLPQSASRLDYFMVSRDFDCGRFGTKWSRFDHASIYVELQFQHTQYGKTILKDWSLASPSFQEQAPLIVRDILIRYDQNLRNMNETERDLTLADRNISEYEQELCISDPQMGITHAHVLMDIIEALQHLQKKVQNKLKYQRRAHLEELSKELATLYRRIDRIPPNTPEYNYINEQITDIKIKIRTDSDMVEMANRTRISHFYESTKGKNVAASFYVCKENKRGSGIKKLIEGNVEITEYGNILDKLTDAYLGKVGHRFTPSMTLQEFLDKYEITLPVLPADEFDYMDMPYSIEEIKNALKTAKKTSSPGPSGQGISLFKYIFKIIPCTFMSALNELTFVPGLVHDDAFQWLLSRNIVYIPKPGKEPNSVGNVRPLSLLETLYKLQTKILTDRMSGALEQVLYSNQHGFQRNKSILSASFPIIEAINEAERNAKRLQLLSVDIQSAFDSIDPNCIFQVMTQEQFPNIFVEAMANLTSTGTGRVSLKGGHGNTFDIKCGSGQGNPPSAGNFNLGSDPLLRALDKTLKRLQYQYENGITLPTTAYADDHLHGLSLLRAEQVKIILEVYNDYEKVSGLKMSPGKTVILGINTPGEMLQQIQAETGIQVVEGFRFLGLEIRSTHSETVNESYSAAHARQQAKYDRIHSTHLDMMHKKQLISSVIIPSYNHIFMALGVHEEWCKKIDNHCVKLLWTHNEGGTLRQKRRLIARRRLNASYEYGGLQLTFSEQTAKGLLLNGLNRIKEQTRMENDKKFIMTKIFEHEIFRIMGVTLGQLFKMAGSRTWKHIATVTQSAIIGQMCGAMSGFLAIQENNRDTWLAMPILGHSLSPPLFRITVHEAMILSRHGYTHVAQLFAVHDTTGKINKASSADFRALDDNLQTKCKALRARIGSNNNLSTDYTPSESILKTLDRVKWSNTYKKIYRNKVDNTFPGPPSYFSRQKDGIPVPEMKKFMAGYIKLFRLKLHSKTLETNFLLLNRQIWTNLKQNLSGGDEEVSALCNLCGQIENTMHLMFECERYSEPLWRILGENLTRMEGKRIIMHAYSVLYNLDIAHLTPTKNDEVLYFIQEVKRSIIFRRYLRCTGQGGNVNYTDNRIIAHILLVLKKTLYQKQLEGSEYGYLELLNQTLVGSI